MEGFLGMSEKLSEEMTFELRSEYGLGHFGSQSLMREKVMQTNKCNNVRKLDALTGTGGGGGGRRGGEIGRAHV